MNTAASRARHRDNAERLGKLQTAAEGAVRSLNVWLDTAAGQLVLIGTAGVLLLVAMTIGP